MDSRINSFLCGFLRTLLNYWAEGRSNIDSPLLKLLNLNGFDMSILSRVLGRLLKVHFILEG